MQQNVKKTTALKVLRRIAAYGAILIAIAYSQPAVRCLYNPLGEDDISGSCARTSRMSWLPTSARTQALRYLIGSHLAQGNASEAIQTAQQAIALDPLASDNTHILTNTFMLAGQTAYGQKDYASAANYYSKALEGDSGNAHLLHSRGDTYYSMEKYDAAIADYSAALAALPPGDDQIALAIHSSRGYLYLQQKSYAAAVEDFTKAIDLNPKSAEAFDQRSYARRQLKDSAGALQDAETAILLAPINSAYHGRKVSALLGLSKFDDALTAIDQWEKAIGNPTATTESQRGYAFERKGYNKLAMEAFGRAIAMDPKDPYAYRQRGFIKWQNLGDLTGAIQDLEDAIALGDRDAEEYRADIRKIQRR